MKRTTLIVVGIIAVLGGLVAVLLLRPADSAVPAAESTSPITAEPDVTPVVTDVEPEPAAPVTPTMSATRPESTMPQSAPLAQGRYIDYNASVVSAVGYN